ncbi:MAG: S8 family peptidase, partial [Pyrinomonadaceae bacterium]
MSGLSLSFYRRRVARWSSIALLTGLLSLAFALPLSPNASLQSSDSSGQKRQRARAKTVPGKILVRYRSEATAKKGERMTAVQSEAVGQIPLSIERFEGSDLVTGLRRVRVSPEQTDAAIDALKERADVLYAEPVYLVHTDATPNDTRYTDLWALRNTGQSGGLAGADIDAEQAWNTTTGSSSVVVGVIDEGIYITHEDLQANIWTNPGEVANNGVDDDGNGFIDDVNGWDFANNDKTVYDGPSSIGPGVNPAFVVDAHATHVAGTIGAVGNNGKGVAGVNWNVKIMSLKFIGSNGLGSIDDEIIAFYYARQMRQMWESSGHTRGANLRVLNNSYGGSPFSQATYDAISALNDAGILFVAAAGNTDDGLIDNDTDPHYPSSYDLPNVISVAATDRNDGLAFFSHYGANSVHIAAPGRDILSTTPVNTYSLNSGTSMATPQVTGAAALLCAAYPD